MYEMATANLLNIYVQCHVQVWGEIVSTTVQELSRENLILAQITITTVRNILFVIWLKAEIYFWLQI